MKHVKPFRFPPDAATGKVKVRFEYEMEGDDDFDRCFKVVKSIHFDYEVDCSEYRKFIIVKWD